VSTEEKRLPNSANGYRSNLSRPVLARYGIRAAKLPRRTNTLAGTADDEKLSDTML